MSGRMDGSVEKLKWEKVEYQSLFGNSQAVQWCGLWTSTPGSIPGQGATHMPCGTAKIKNYLNNIDYLRISPIGTRIVELTKMGKTR